MFKLSNLSAIIKQFHFVAHENPSNSGDKVNGEQFPPTNHWSLLLTLSTSVGVEVDITPNEPGEPGMVVVESKDYALTSNYTKTVSVDAAEGITVADVFNLIIQEKERLLHPSLCTCRRGMSLLVCILLQMTLLVPISSTQPMLWKFQSALVMYWPTP